MVSAYSPLDRNCNHRGTMFVRDYFEYKWCGKVHPWWEGPFLDWDPKLHKWRKKAEQKCACILSASLLDAMLAVMHIHPLCTLTGCNISSNETHPLCVLTECNVSSNAHSSSLSPDWMQCEKLFQVPIVLNSMPWWVVALYQKKPFPLKLHIKLHIAFDRVYFIAATEQRHGGPHCILCCIHTTTILHRSPESWGYGNALMQLILNTYC